MRRDVVGVLKKFGVHHTEMWVVHLAAAGVTVAALYCRWLGALL